MMNVFRTQMLKCVMRYISLNTTPSSSHLKHNLNLNFQWLLSFPFFIPPRHHLPLDHHRQRLKPCGGSMILKLSLEVISLLSQDFPLLRPRCQISKKDDK